MKVFIFFSQRRSSTFDFHMIQTGIRNPVKWIEGGYSDIDTHTHTHVSAIFRRQLRCTFCVLEIVVVLYNYFHLLQWTTEKYLKKSDKTKRVPERKLQISVFFLVNFRTYTNMANDVMYLYVVEVFKVKFNWLCFY